MRGVVKMLSGPRHRRERGASMLLLLAAASTLCIVFACRHKASSFESSLETVQEMHFARGAMVEVGDYILRTDDLRAATVDRKIERRFHPTSVLCSRDGVGDLRHARWSCEGNQSPLLELGNINIRCQPVPKSLSRRNREARGVCTLEYSLRHRPPPSRDADVPIHRENFEAPSNNKHQAPLAQPRNIRDSTSTNVLVELLVRLFPRSRGGRHMQRLVIRKLIGNARQLINKDHPIMLLKSSLRNFLSERSRRGTMRGDDRQTLGAGESGHHDKRSLEDRKAIPSVWSTLVLLALLALAFRATIARNGVPARADAAAHPAMDAPPAPESVAEPEDTTQSEDAGERASEPEPYAASTADSPANVLGIAPDNTLGSLRSLLARIQVESQQRWNSGQIFKIAVGMIAWRVSSQLWTASALDALIGALVIVGAVTFVRSTFSEQLWAQINAHINAKLPLWQATVGEYSHRAHVSLVDGYAKCTDVAIAARDTASARLSSYRQLASARALQLRSSLQASFAELSPGFSLDMSTVVCLVLLVYLGYHAMHTLALALRTLRSVFILGFAYAMYRMYVGWSQRSGERRPEASAAATSPRAPLPAGSNRGPGAAPAATEADAALGNDGWASGTINFLIGAALAAMAGGAPRRAPRRAHRLRPRGLHGMRYGHFGQTW